MCSMPEVADAAEKLIAWALERGAPDNVTVLVVRVTGDVVQLEADKGRGVITDSAVHARVLADLEEFVAAQAGLCWRGVVESPLLGPAGNKEFLTLIEKIR